MNFKKEGGKMNKFHHVKNLKFTKHQKIFNLNEISRALKNASDVEKMVYEISPSGYGIYWPLLDEDLSIRGLLG